MASYMIYYGDQTDIQTAKEHISSFQKGYTLTEDGELVNCVERFKMKGRLDCLSFYHERPKLVTRTRKTVDEHGNETEISSERIETDYIHTLVFDHGGKTVFLIQDKSGASKVRTRNMLQKILSHEQPYEIRNTVIPQHDLSDYMDKCSRTSNPKYEACDVDYVEFSGEYTHLDPEGKLKKSTRYGQEKGRCVKIDCTTMDEDVFTISLQGTVKITSKKMNRLEDLEGLIRRELLDIICEQ